MPGKRLSVVPPVVTPDDLEDFLAIDDLFIDYFNAFLQLPTFPEPLAFNRTRGGFEVVSDARSQLKTKLQSVARSQQKRKSIYDAPHGVINEKRPPKMPWHYEREEEPDLKTTFSVQCLNKEQGIQWVKEERLTSFLKSDLYLEYRLAKLISQTEIASKGDDLPLNMYIDPDYKPFAVERPVVPAEVIVDEKQQAIRSMFVCMGGAALTHTDAWFSQVKLSNTTSTSNSVNARLSTDISIQNDPVSVGCSSGISVEALQSNGISSGFSASTPSLCGSSSGVSVTSRPLSGVSGNGFIPNSRPLSGCSVGFIGKQRPLSGVSSGFGDSGIWSLGSRDTHSVSFEEELPNRCQLFQSPLRPRSPPSWRPPIGENSCVIADSVLGSSYTHEVVHHLDEPKNAFGDHKSTEEITSDVESDIKAEVEFEVENEIDASKDVILVNSHSIDGHAPSDIKVDAEKEMNVDVIEINSLDARNDVKSPMPSDVEINIYSPSDVIRVSSLESVASLLVSHVMKKVLVDICDHPVSEVDSYVNNIILHESDFSAEQLDKDWMDRIEMTSDFEEDSKGRHASHEDCSESQEEWPNEPCAETEQSVGKISTAVPSEGGKDQSDTDSLLDSETDDGLSSSDLSSRSAVLTCHLNSIKGINAFKEFLQGTAGEKCWDLWLDIDKGRWIQETPVQLVYLSQMRDKYLKTGGLCELSPECRDTLGLAIPSQWSSVPKLLSLQDKLLRPLLLYWAPRFLMRVTYQCHLGPSFEQRRLNTRTDTGPYQKPKSKALLPLRPKTCIARIRSSTTASSQSSGEKTTSLKPQRPKSAVDAGRVSALPLHNTGSVSAVSIKLPASHGRGHLCGDMSSLTRRKSNRKMDNSPTRLGEPCTKGQSDGYVSQLTENSRLVDGAADVEADMNQLLEGLCHEERAGGYFMRYLQKHGDQVLVNALNCWHEIQDYHMLFHAEVFSPYALARKAEEIHSKFIVEGSHHPINCPSMIQTQVYREIIPPFEELFDGTEEYILKMLLGPWAAMRASDKVLYDKIHQSVEERQLEGVTSRHLQKLQRRLNRERMFTPDFHVEDDNVESKREAHYKSLAEKIPAELKDYDFNKLIHNRLELENFRAFLDDNYALVDLLCWLDIESFRRTSHLESAKRDQKARDIKTKYLNKKYFLGPNSPATRKQQNEVMISGGGWGKLLLDRTPTPILLEAQKYVQERLERKWLPMFICTEEFQTRQRPNMSVGDVTDDLLLNRRKRSQAIYKILESRWVSSSREITLFRQALQNPLTCQQFRKFVSVKGENLENDVLFWLEVQKFKDMYHNHTEDSLIHQKITAIIRCFIDSEIHPGLHIDITPEQVDRILDKRPREMGPYVFRDAQLTVFRVLFSHWGDFLKYRNSVADDKLLEDLERKKQRKKKKDAEQRRLQEEKESKAPKSEADGLGSRRMSHVTNLSADFLDEEERDEKVQWRYSDYMRALEREDALLSDDHRAESIMTSIDSLASGSQFGDAEEDEDKQGNMGDKNSVQTATGVTKAKKKVTLPEPAKKTRKGSAGVKGHINPIKAGTKMRPRSVEGRGMSEGFLHASDREIKQTDRNHPTNVMNGTRPSSSKHRQMKAKSLLSN